MSTARDPMSDDGTLRRFLLGTLEEPARARLEEELFKDTESFERLLRLEEDLVSAYVNKTLDDEERVPFERQYLATPPAGSASRLDGSPPNGRRQAAPRRRSNVRPECHPPCFGFAPTPSASRQRLSR